VAESWEIARQVLGGLCLAGGSVVVLTTGIALLRLPTYYTRVHGASISETLGAGLILLGLAFHADELLVVSKLALVLVFMVLTGPATAHALAKAAYLHGVRPELPSERLEEDAPEEATGTEGPESGNEDETTNREVAP
jgi:multicomponent Na+:H+ antiporter subunit G